MERAGNLVEKMVVFAVGSQEYAVPISAVREVQAWTMPTPVPEAPEIVEGVIDLRGEIIPVVDLGRRFGIERWKQGADARIMVIDLGGRRAGWIVDEVVEVHTPAPGAVTPPSQMLLQVAAASDPVVAGILRVGDGRLVVVLDASRILEAALQ